MTTPALVGALICLFTSAAALVVGDSEAPSAETHHIPRADPMTWATIDRHRAAGEIP